jgi:hypothetical protein
VLAGCAGKLQKPDGPVALAYGGAAGEKHAYEVELTLRGQVALQGVPQLVAMKLAGRLQERIDEVRKDGSRRVSLIYDFSPLEVNGMIAGEEQFPRHLEIAAVRSRTGEVESPAGQSLAGQGSAADSGALGWTMRFLCGLTPLLPASPVMPGEKWETVRSAPAPGGGEFRILADGVLKGMIPDISPVAGAGRIAKLSAGGSVVLVKPASGDGLELFHLEYTGDAGFGLAGGCVVEAKREGRIRMKARNGSNRVEARLGFTSTLKAAV